MKTPITLILLCILSIFQLEAQVAGPVAVGPNEYAFQYTPFPGIGLFFNGTDQRYEFKDVSGSPVLWIAPQTGRTFFETKVGVGIAPSVADFQVDGISFLGSATDYTAINSTGDLTFSGTADMLVGNNRYAFRAATNENYGLFFNATEKQYEFRNSVAEATMVLRADGGRFLLTDSLGETMFKLNGDNMTVGSLGANSGITLEGSATTNRVRIRFNNNGPGAHDWIMQSSSTDAPSGISAFVIRDETANQNRMAIDTSGRVAIGRDSARAALDVNGSLRIGDSGEEIKGVIRYDGTVDRFQGHNGTEWIALDKGKNWSGNDNTTSTFREGQTRIGTSANFANDQLIVENNGYTNALRVRIGGVGKMLVSGTGGTTIGGSFASPPTDGLYVKGDVTIGNTTPASGYKLSVDGKVICEEVRVQQSTAWPDYVFNSSYQLPSLKTLKNEIAELGHLPGIPSAQVVESEGYEVGAMQAAVLQKVEELTLYVIELHEEIEALKNKNSELHKKVNSK